MKEYDVPMSVKETTLLERLERYMSDYMQDKKIEDLDGDDLEKYFQEGERDVENADYRLMFLEPLNNLVTWYFFDNDVEKREQWHKKLREGRERDAKREKEEAWKNVYLNPPPTRRRLGPIILDDDELKIEIDRLTEERRQRHGERVSRTDMVKESLEQTL